MLEIEVFADWQRLADPHHMGTLKAEKTRGEQVFSFEYQKEWLEGEYAQDIDPDLKLYQGPQYTSDDKLNFGLFLDSCPDRWGRMLMQRRESIMARKDRREIKRLLESDFLLGVNDETRMGGLRIGASEFEN